MSKRFLSILAFVLASISATVLAGGAESSALAQEPVVKGVSPVIQFGAPNESKYVFCFEGECPGHTRKTIRVVEPEPVRPPLVIEPDLALDEKEELVQPVQAKKVKKARKRMPPKKPRVDCAAPAK